MKDVYDELRKIWDNIPQQEQTVDFTFDLGLHKKLLDIFQVGDYFYLILNIRKSLFEFLSPELEKVLGHKLEDIDVAYFVNLIHPEDLPVFLNFEAGVETFFSKLPADKLYNYKVQYDMRMRKADGTYIRMLHQMVIIAHNGEDVKTFVVYTDITNLKREVKPTLSFIGLEGEPSYLNVDVQDIFRPKKQLFTKREREIIKALANGLSSSEIGASLNISRFTVDSHRKNMLKKTNAKSTNEIIRLAFDNGWV